MDLAEFESVQLSACGICGRKFNPTVLAKHQNICKKSLNKKPRKEFNPSKQRVGDLGIKTPKNGPGRSGPASEPAKPKPSWKKQSEDFRAQMKYARQVKQAELQGTALPEAPQLQNDPTENYVSCPFCSRKFNETAGPRHIKFCETQAKKVPRSSKPENSVSQFKQDKRLNYKPPKLATGKKADSMAGPGSFGLGNHGFAATSNGSRNGSATMAGKSHGHSPSIKNMQQYGSSRSASSAKNTPNLASTARATTGRRPENRHFQSSNFDLQELQNHLPDSSSHRNVNGSSRQINTVKRGPNRVSSKAREKSCGECSTSYPVDWANFCSMCGKKRK